MKSSKNSGKLLIACIALVSVTVLLKASYYKPDFFPIGLTGLNGTGSPMSENCPYSNVDWPNSHWNWNEEQSLIFDLGVNCIGCQDAKPDYLVDLYPDDPDGDNYLNKVCKPSFEDDGDSTNPTRIYIITAGFSTKPKYWLPRGKMYYNGQGDKEDTVFWQDTFRVLNPGEDFFLDTTNVNTVVYNRDGSGNAIVWAPNTWKNHATSYLFRTATRGPVLFSDQAGYGSMQFAHHTKDYEYNRHGDNSYDGDNTWNTFDGDSVWKEMIDTTVLRLESYFDNNGSNAQYIWGLNVISEDNGCFRGTSTNTPWRGCWAAVDYFLTGHKDNTAFKGEFTPASTHNGIRGVDSSSNRMLIAKFNPYCHHKMGYNIFKWLPDIDAVVAFWHGWCRAEFNYGEQDLFDQFLYGTRSVEIDPKMEKVGYHNNAIYMQLNGDTQGGPTSQKRRWIPWIALEWIGASNGHPEIRRPCPPEIRCAAYLLMSRGAKGILFHGWSFSINDDNKTLPNIQIPYEGSSFGKGNVGIRDANNGYPFGHGPNASSHKLNNGTGSTYWHQEANRYDKTYDYLCDLIPELKLITPKLMELDWINGYSLKSSSPGWNLPCPHYYVEDVWGVEYADLGFFDHPYEPIGVEYFMLVNREGIADMTNRNVSVALDADHWPEADSLILTNIANRDNSRTLTREGERFIFSEEFEPGEGKLYRVAPAQEPPITYISKGGAR